MSIPGWFREEMKRTQSVYDELREQYPESIEYISNEGFWIANNNLNEEMNKSGFWNNASKKEATKIMQNKLATLAKKLVEDGYDLRPGTYEVWLKMVCEKLRKITGSSPDIQNILTILSIARGER